MSIAQGVFDICLFYSQTAHESVIVDLTLHLFFSYRELKIQFENLLKTVSKMLRKSHRYFVFVDGLESMEKGRFAHHLDWLPEKIPNVSMIRKLILRHLFYKQCFFCVKIVGRVVYYSEGC